MKKIDLYEIAIKILGLYLVVIIISQLREILVYATVWLQQENNPQQFGGFDQTPIIIVSVLGFLAIIILSGFLIFNTNKIARIISKPSDYEEDIKLFAERKTIFEICMVLLGLVTIVLALPDFIFKLKNYLTIVQNHMLVDKYETAFLYTSALKIAIGFVAIVFSKQLALFLTKKEAQNEEPNQ